MLVSRSKVKTNYVLPVHIGSFYTFWYYENERDLFRAYKQLLKINGKIKPFYPIVFWEEYKYGYVFVRN